MEIILRKGTCIPETSELAGATLDSDNSITPMYNYFTPIDCTYDFGVVPKLGFYERVYLSLFVESLYIELAILSQHAWTQVS